MLEAVLEQFWQGVLGHYLSSTCESLGHSTGAVLGTVLEAVLGGSTGGSTEAVLGNTGGGSTGNSTGDSPGAVLSTVPGAALQKLKSMTPSISVWVRLYSSVVRANDHDLLGRGTKGWGVQTLLRTPDQTQTLIPDTPDPKDNLPKFSEIVGSTQW